ncbi:MAG: hypothetical protein MUO53_06935, partial [Maribacter sp.]|nr:hypothetical protein [Maribacter sp.]
LSLFIGHSQKLDLSYLENLAIRNVGPANMSGRITAIDAVTENPKIIYVGAASGGVWKSENGGTAWYPIFDDQPTQNIGAIAIQQNNPSVVWVGTGEGNPRNSMNLGMGIFKSLDAGKTWKPMGLEATKTIHRILVDPQNPDVIYVGAMGDPFTPSEHRGLYKTTDGGQSWKKILYTNQQSGIADLIIDPTNPNTLFAAMYEHRRTPYSFTSGGPGSGIFVTHDGGDNWKPITDKNGLPAGELGRCGLAIAPSDPNRLYAKIEATKNALYRSDDGGYNWYKVNDDPKFTNNRPFYFQDLAVDPKDANRLYNIYQPVSVSYDGGKTFDPVPMIPADETKGIHADFHAFWVNPHDPENFIIGGDGGLGITNDHGKSWYYPETIPVAQLYHVNVDNERPYQVYAGMQDNGNWSGPGYTWKRGGIRTLYWQYLVGGDGFDISPDLENPRFGYGSSQNGNLYRYDQLTGYYVSIIPSPPSLQTRLRFNWNAAFARDPKNPKTVYYGSQFVHVTHDKGANWEIISPDLTTNTPEHQKSDYGGLTLDVSGAEIYNSILTIAPSPIDDKIIWAGTDDGQVQLTTDGGKTWRNLTEEIKGLPREGWIAQIKASRYNAGEAWVVVNNYRKGDYAPYLFKTVNYGKTWSRLVDGNKVNGYALSVLQDPVEPKLVFLGTENGLWISIDEGMTWEKFENGFPSVSTMDMVVQEPESALIIGTFGRAIWILDDLLSLREIARYALKPTLTALPNNSAVQVKGLFINPPGNIWTGFHTTFEGENKLFQGIEIPFYLTDAPDSTTSVSASIFQNETTLIKRIEKKKLVKGLNYIPWKLDEQSATLPSGSSEEDLRGIPVLPGKYKIVLGLGSVKDSSTVTVINDPRFDLAPQIDVKLHDFQRDVDIQVAKLAELLIGIDTKKDRVNALEKQLKNLDYKPDDLLRLSTMDMLDALDTLRAKGQAVRPKRQLGAWQSFEVTPYSKIQEVLMMSAARTTIPSASDLGQLEMAKNLIDEFAATVDDFLKHLWAPFEEKINNSKIDWFNELGAN